MKEIKEEIKREVIDTHIYYEAPDGTRFDSKEECQKYETSALGVVRTKVAKLQVGKETNAWDLMGGFDDHSVVAFKPKSKEDVDAIMQLMLLYNPYLTEDHCRELREKRYNTILAACENNDIVLFGINCDEEYYFINSCQNIINNLNNLDKAE